MAPGLLGQPQSHPQLEFQEGAIDVLVAGRIAFVQQIEPGAGVGRALAAAAERIGRHRAQVVRPLAVHPGARALPEALRMRGAQVQRGAQIGLAQVVQPALQQFRGKIVGDDTEGGVQAGARRGVQRGQRLQGLQRETAGGFGALAAHREGHRTERDEGARLGQRRIRTRRERLRPTACQRVVACNLRGDGRVAKDQR